MLVDWRGGNLPREPGKIRPAVVVEDDLLFPDAYPNTLVVPLTRDHALAIEAFAEKIESSTQTGSDAPSWALAHHVTSVSLQRITPTGLHISAEQLASIRMRIALALGL